MRDILRRILRAIRIRLAVRYYRRMVDCNPAEANDRILRGIYARAGRPLSIAESNRLRYTLRLKREGDN
jgi:hypothetical protein